MLHMKVIGIFFKNFRYFRNIVTNFNNEDRRNCIFQNT